MKRFIIWILVVLITVFVVDAIIGVSFSRYIKSHALPGDYESIERVLRNNDAELLVLGSSVALNSINNKVLEDSLNLKSYNGGGNGQRFPFFLTMLKAAVKQKVPQKVLLCVQPSAFSKDGLGSRYNIFAPYYGLGIADIDSNLNGIKANNELFLKSASYRLNTIWFRILLYHFVNAGIKGENGHISKPVPPVFPTKFDVTIGEITAERRKELIEFLEICRDNNIDLTIIFTPEYYSIRNSDDPDNLLSQVKDLANEYGAKVYMDTELEPFASSPELFYDSYHINIEGTKIYTPIILNRLKCTNSIK